MGCRRSGWLVLTSLVRRRFHVPRPQRSLLVRWLFLRGVGFVYACAFTSLHRQVLGLYGSQGIVPIADRLTSVRRATGGQLGHAWRCCPRSSGGKRAQRCHPALAVGPP